eukprot:TRINITY_DN5989_c0_g1_i3.p1 TRINITY_DN5989_c0_g1~~TRINITY_DN5989_c0_g1_i3.p1  ORF type:complete len:595 (-),score=152.16 TRINITY_DN5989_c0_g1_i3:76-1860(-)
MTAAPSQQVQQDNAVHKALREFRRDLIPTLQVDLKDHLIKQAKEELTDHLRQELRKEIKQLSNKMNKEMAANSNTIKNILSEQVKKMEQSSKAIDQSTLNLKHIKAFSKSKPGQLSSGRKSTALALRKLPSRGAETIKDAAEKATKALEGSGYAPLASAGGPGDSGDVGAALLGASGQRTLEIAVNDDDVPPEPVEETLPATPLQESIAQFLNHWLFDAGMAIILVIGAVLMGVSLEFGIDAYMDYYDIACAVIFTIELAARLYCYRSAFFTMEGYEWNIFDMVIVVCQLAACLSQTSSAASGFKSLRGLKGLRTLRSLRVLRTLRLVRFVEEFRSVIVSLLAALKSTIGILLLLVLGLYLFGASMAQEVLDRRHEVADGASPELEKYFGSLSAAMLSLYESVTGGLTWSIAMNVLLEEQAYTMAVIYVAFITLVFFVLLNVITAVFTGQAVIALQDDQDLMVIKDIDALFLKGDLQCGDITWGEFRSMVHTPEMTNLFKSLNIDTSEARQLFRLLDTQGVGTLDYQEFIDGCLRLRGPAKSLELVKLMKEHTAMNIWTEQKLNGLDQHVVHVANGLSKLSHQLQAQMHSLSSN